MARARRACLKASICSLSSCRVKIDMGGLWHGGGGVSVTRETEELEETRKALYLGRLQKKGGGQLGSEKKLGFAV